MSWSGHLPSRGFVFPRPFVVVKWTIYLVAPAALWAAHNYRTLEDYFDSRGEMRRNRAEVASLEQERDRLLAEKRKLDVGGFAAEKAVRERLMMVRPGEKVILLESEPAPGEVRGVSEDPLLAHPDDEAHAPPSRLENEDGLDLEFESHDGEPTDGVHSFDSDLGPGVEPGAVHMDSDPG